MDLKTYMSVQKVSQVQLASLLGVTQGAISQWLSNRIPAERVLDIERNTGVSRHDLRPDLYPRDDVA